MTDLTELKKLEKLAPHSARLAVVSESKHLGAYESLRMSVPTLIARVEKLEAEAALARRRLGPAGYKVLQDHLKLIKRAEKLERAIDCLMFNADKTDTKKANEILEREGR